MPAAARARTTTMVENCISKGGCLDLDDVENGDEIVVLLVSCFCVS